MMRPGILSDIAWIAGSTVLAGMMLVYLYCTASDEVFNLALGIVLGAIVAAIPTFLVRRAERRAKGRASALLWRDDMYLYQDWIVRSIKAEAWQPAPSSVATSEHLADIADAIPKWSRWQRITRARRWSAELSSRCASASPAELADLAKRTFIAINDARVVLARVDGGKTRAHLRTTYVREFAEKHPQSAVSPELFEP